MSKVQYGSMVFHELNLDSASYITCAYNASSVSCATHVSYALVHVPMCNIISYITSVCLHMPLCWCFLLVLIFSHFFLLCMNYVWINTDVHFYCISSHFLFVMHELCMNQHTTTTTGSVTREKMVDGVVAIYKDHRNLALTLRDSQQMVNKLGTHACPKDTSDLS